MGAASIQPGNIMVEAKADGTFWPYVLDFGLAEVVTHSDGDPRTGLEGTPAFMSPEQARGELQSLDRRTDVYSLGATLYDLLAGQPPFGKGRNQEVLLAVLLSEPQRTRLRQHGVPADLESVVMKCLEKDPADRYESAKALADDLQRYLDDEPVLAQPANLFYRLAKKAAKNRYTVASMILASVAILFLCGVFIRARIQAAEQRRLAQDFGQTIEEIEMIMRSAYTLPLHDTRREKRMIRARISHIAAGIAQLDADGAALSHYAIGRGHLALQEFDAALEHLRAAHDAGLDSPAVAYALGLTLGELYNKQFKEVQRRSGKRFTVDKQRIDHDLLEPALHYLRRSSEQKGRARPLAQGFLAFYSQQYEDALRLAGETLEHDPWLYEAKKLQADVYYAYGRSKQSHGQYREGRNDYAQAAELYHEAADMARSDSSIHSAEADMWVQLMEIDKTQGRSPKDAFERALAACDRAIAANPENDSAVRKKVWALTRWAEYQSAHGEDPRDAAGRAIATAQVAIGLNPKNAFPYEQIGLACLLSGTYEGELGLETKEWEQRAEEQLQKSLEVNPNFAWAWNDLGNLYAARARWLARRGEDARPALQTAVSRLQRAIEADSDYHLAYSNLVSVYQQLASQELERGRIPSEWIERALETSERALQANPHYFLTFRNLAAVHALQASVASSQGQSAETALDEADKAARQAVTANPSDAETQRIAAAVAMQRARALLAQHSDAKEELERGLTAIKQSLMLRPRDAGSLLLLSQLLALSAQRLTQDGRSPEDAFRQAQDALQRAKEASPRDGDVYLALAELAAVKGDWQGRSQLPAKRTLTAGDKAVTRALSLHPSRAAAMAVRGKLQILTARSETHRRPRGRLADLGAQAIRQALALNPLLAREYQPLLAEAEKYVAATGHRRSHHGGSAHQGSEPDVAPPQHERRPHRPRNA